MNKKVNKKTSYPLVGTNIINCAQRTRSLSPCGTTFIALIKKLEPLLLTQPPLIIFGTISVSLWLRRLPSYH